MKAGGLGFESRRVHFPKGIHGPFSPRVFKNCQILEALVEYDGVSQEFTEIRQHIIVMNHM